MDERIRVAERAYESAVFAGDHGGVPDARLGLDAVEADLVLARGRLLHAEFLAESPPVEQELRLFERAAELYRAAG